MSTQIGDYQLRWQARAGLGWDIPLHTPGQVTLAGGEALDANPDLELSGALEAGTDLVLTTPGREVDFTLGIDGGLTSLKIGGRFSALFSVSAPEKDVRYLLGPYIVVGQKGVDIQMDDCSEGCWEKIIAARGDRPPPELHVVGGGSFDINDRVPYLEAGVQYLSDNFNPDDTATLAGFGISAGYLAGLAPVSTSDPEVTITVEQSHGVVAHAEIHLNLL